MGTLEIAIVQDGQALAPEAARRVTAIAREQIARHDQFTIALSGGSTPRALYHLLAAPPYREAMPWNRTHVFFGDERTVAPDDDQSNYRMARESLLDHVPLPYGQIHRIEAEREPHEAAESYERVLRETFGLEVGQVPAFGLILLGLGPDGHTASLFPNTEALEEQRRLVVENVVPQLNTSRITLTIPVITQAQHVMLLVSGVDKADAVWRALQGPYALDQTPAQLVREALGRVCWVLDTAAATRLNAGSVTEWRRSVNREPGDIQ